MDEGTPTVDQDIGKKEEERGGSKERGERVEGGLKRGNDGDAEDEDEEDEE